MKGSLVGPHVNTYCKQVQISCESWMGWGEEMDHTVEAMRVSCLQGVSR
jgi:hypothetical protein